MIIDSKAPGELDLSGHHTDPLDLVSTRFLASTVRDALAGGSKAAAAPLC